MAGRREQWQSFCHCSGFGLVRPPVRFGAGSTLGSSGAAKPALVPRLWITGKPVDGGRRPQACSAQLIRPIEPGGGSTGRPVRSAATAGPSREPTAATHRHRRAEQPPLCAPTAPTPVPPSQSTPPPVSRSRSCRSLHRCDTPCYSAMCSAGWRERARRWHRSVRPGHCRDRSPQPRLCGERIDRQRRPVGHGGAPAQLHLPVIPRGRRAHAADLPRRERTPRAASRPERRRTGGLPRRQPHHPRHLGSGRRGREQPAGRARGDEDAEPEDDDLPRSRAGLGSVGRPGDRRPRPEPR